MPVEMARVTTGKPAAKKKKKPKLTQAQLRERSERRRKLLTSGLRYGSIAAVIAGAVIGFHVLADHVRADLTIPEHPTLVELVDKPDWMTDRIEATIRLGLVPGSPRSTLDDDLLKETYAKLQRNAWVDEIQHVVRRRDEASGRDQLEIYCTWRQPTAIVRYDNSEQTGDSYGIYHLVANTSAGPVLLPMSYSLDEIDRMMYGSERPTTNLKVITNVDTAPPNSAGSVWKGVALQAGIDVAELLMASPGTEDITGIDVHNVRYETSNTASARATRSSVDYSPVVLMTRYGCRIYWGRRPRASDYLVEASPQKKLEHIAQLHDYFGGDQADPDRDYPEWADIRTDYVKIKRKGE